MKKLLFLIFSLLLVSCGGGSGGGGHAALCNDGTYSDSQSCSGTCSSHGGVKEWYVQCGSSASKLSSAIVSSETPTNNAGSWVGTWINKKENMAGTLRLNITEKTLITGTLFNKDNAPNSNLHSYITDNGTVRFFLDIPHSLNETAIEYPADISLNKSGEKLLGSINIQQNEKEEIRDIELHRE